MKARSKELLDRAIAATIAAIEIYNKRCYRFIVRLMVIVPPPQLIGSATRCFVHVHGLDMPVTENPIEFAAMSLERCCLFVVNVP